MITCPAVFFTMRCRQRGYTREEVEACVVAEADGQITVDEGHPAYPKEAKPGFVPTEEDIEPPPPPPPPPVKVLTGGPGTELKKLLKLVGITASPTCSCNTRAMTMDANGCEWCEANIDTIVGWLREEATKRGLPFVDTAGRLLVKRAIRNARKAGQSSEPPRTA
jgi:hypothetical protein